MVVSHVGAVRPLETIAPLSSVVLDDIQSCSDSEASDDDLLLVGALAPMNRPAVCCARLDDFNLVVPDCVPDIFLSGRDIEVGLTDLSHDLQVLPDVFPVVSAGAAAVPMPLPVVAESVSQVVIRKEAAPVVVPLAEEVTLRVGMVGLKMGVTFQLSCQGLNVFYRIVVLLMLVCLFRRGLRSYLQGVLLCRRPCRPLLKCFPLLILLGGSLLRQPPGRGRDSHGSNFQRILIGLSLSVRCLWTKLWITPWMWLVCMLDSCGSGRIRRVFCH